MTPNGVRAGLGTALDTITGLPVHPLVVHAVIVLLAVAAGSSLYGIVGAFLAVPVAAVAAVVIRYIGEQIDERASDNEPMPAGDASDILEDQDDDAESEVENKKA